MASYYDNNTVIYHNGAFVKAADAKMDLYSQSLHYGYSVFEGIRSYRTADGETKIFKVKEHYDRLQASAAALNLPYTWNTQELTDITYEVLNRNGLGDAYIRPVIYAPANMSFNPNAESLIVIEAWEMAPFLGEKLLRVTVSSFQRPNPKGFKIHAKAAGHYVNSILASQEAKGKGYDEALLLDMNDKIAEAPGANVFFEKAGVLYTPALGNILPGITRATVLELCDELNIRVVEGQFTQQDLYGADAAFFCGTAAEVVGFQSLDDVGFAMPWEETQSRLVQIAYKNLVVENKTELVNEITGIE
ncbi:branched-chain-amino-acid transaminase [Sediminibacterium soli]|uniref:branched-chain-amino-acid transaminase n=1 Tax=Sediminibacterium soli TaxID=2698829 RepID=UPI00137AB7B3|nr:branched-chain-amino-acid transaminase [Sediminibacterium soli]NCI45198.1 branched-chain-amino-acid transaminase [Sediminibacterium soli]